MYIKNINGNKKEIFVGIYQKNAEILEKNHNLRKFFLKYFAKPLDIFAYMIYNIITTVVESG